MAILSMAASVALGRLARHGLPARPAPPQRGGVARPALRVPRAVRGAHRLRTAHPGRAHRARGVPRAVRERRHDRRPARPVTLRSRVSRLSRPRGARRRPGRLAAASSTDTGRGSCRGRVDRLRRQLACDGPAVPASARAGDGPVRPAEATAVVEQVLVDRPVRRVHEQRSGLPPAQAAVAPDELLERRDLVEHRVVERVDVDVGRVGERRRLGGSPTAASGPNRREWIHADDRAGREVVGAVRRRGRPARHPS